MGRKKFSKLQRSGNLNGLGRKSRQDSLGCDTFRQTSERGRSFVVDLLRPVHGDDRTS